MKKIRIKLFGRDGHSAYVALPGYPAEVTGGIVSKTIDLKVLLPNSGGPRVHLDFNDEDILIGIEILVPLDEDSILDEEHDIIDGAESGVDCDGEA